MYIGLLIESKEPSPSTGYARVEGDLNRDVFFPTSCGYGVVTHIALFDAAEGGEPSEIIALAAAVDCHEGVIPIIHEGQLLRGVDVTAKVKMKSGDKCQV